MDHPLGQAVTHEPPPPAVTARFNIGDRVIFATPAGDVDRGTVQSIIFDSEGTFYDIERYDDARTVVQRVLSRVVDPDPN